ncbi:hypothetical protein AB4254_11615 [Vibrio breoganii]
MASSRDGNRVQSVFWLDPYDSSDLVAIEQLRDLKAKYGKDYDAIQAEMKQIYLAGTYLIKCSPDAAKRIARQLDYASPELLLKELGGAVEQGAGSNSSDSASQTINLLVEKLSNAIGSAPTHNTTFESHSPRVTDSNGSPGVLERQRRPTHENAPSQQKDEPSGGEPLIIPNLSTQERLKKSKSMSSRIKGF